jgi:hypothetical protein
MQQQAAYLAEAVSVFRVDGVQPDLAAPLRAVAPRVALPRAAAPARKPVAKASARNAAAEPEWEAF